MDVIFFGIIVGITTSVLGVGWLDGNIPIAMASNIGPIFLYVTIRAGLKP